MHLLRVIHGAPFTPFHGSIAKPFFPGIVFTTTSMGYMNISHLKQAYGYFTVALGSFLEGETVLLAGSQEPIDTQAAFNLRRVFSIPRRYDFEKLVSMVLRAIQGLSGCIALSCTALQIIAGAKRLA